MKINIKDEWQTPDELYNWLDSIYHFKYDLCANKDNIKVGVVEDLFKRDKIDNNAFMNPPYSNIGPFIKKAWELSSSDNTVVCLVPSSIKTCKYMDFLDVRGGSGIIRRWDADVTWHDFARRTKFTHPTLKASSPTFGCSLLILNRGRKEKLE